MVKNLLKSFRVRKGIQLFEKRNCFPNKMETSWPEQEEKTDRNKVNSIQEYELKFEAQKLGVSWQ